MKKKRLLISLIIPYYHNMFSTFYTLEIIKEASKAAIDLDVDLLLETSWRMSAEPGMSGILFLDMMGNEAFIKKARAKKIPHLILNYYNPDPKDNCIGINNKKAAFEAADYLIQAGHTRIATITGKLNAQAGRQRLEGFEQALKAANIKLDKRYVVISDWARASGNAAMKKLLALSAEKRPSAVFVAGDEMAIGAIEAVKEAGLKVPEDISFVGFDNILEAARPDISLTTVQQPFSELAKLGMKNLLKVIKNKTTKPVKILLNNTELIRRKSVRELA